MRSKPDTAYWTLAAPAFRCRDCGEVFDTPKEWVETHGLDYGPYERWSGCPACGGAFEEYYGEDEDHGEGEED